MCHRDPRGRSDWGSGRVLTAVPSMCLDVDSGSRVGPTLSDSTETTQGLGPGCLSTSPAGGEGEQGIKEENTGLVLRRDSVR